VVDRLSEALRYKAQGFWPLPTIGKIPDRRWKGLQSRQLTSQEMHEAWPTKGDANVALVCGPAAHLLVLNVNAKNGIDGRMLLQHRGLTIPRTPEVITASGTGRAYLFKVPDVQSPFRLYTYPKGWKGLELRGVGGIQVMPPSRTATGLYRFADGWTLTRLMVDLGDLPEWLLDLWITLDRGAQNFARERPEHLGKPRQPASAPARTTDLSPPPHTQQKRSQARPAEQPETPPPHLTTITTTLLAWNDSDFDDDDASDKSFIDDWSCAQHLSRRVGLDEGLLASGQPFLCILPGHGESHPSATWFKTTSGHFIYHDWHVKSGEAFWPLPDVFAALVTGQLKRLPKPSRKTWRLRLMVEAGLLEPYPVEMIPLPDDLPPLMRRFCEGFRYLCACKWTFQERAPTMFSDAFAAGWCGIREGSIWKLRRLALAHGFMVAARDDDGRLVYLPGKEHSS
jgi:hypothetical protein